MMYSDRTDNHIDSDTVIKFLWCNCKGDFFLFYLHLLGVTILSYGQLYFLLSRSIIFLF